MYIYVLVAILKYNYILNSKEWNLKSTIKQFRPDSLTVQALLDLEIPSNKTE
jgi:hypothetical protein